MSLVLSQLPMRCQIVPICPLEIKQPLACGLLWRLCKRLARWLPANFGAVDGSRTRVARSSVWCSTSELPKLTLPFETVHGTPRTNCQHRVHHAAGNNVNHTHTLKMTSQRVEPCSNHASIARQTSTIPTQKKNSPKPMQKKTARSCRNFELLRIQHSLLRVSYWIAPGFEKVTGFLTRVVRRQ